jgi:hypothetical protein
LLQYSGLFNTVHMLSPEGKPLLEHLKVLNLYAYIIAILLVIHRPHRESLHKTIVHLDRLHLDRPHHATQHLLDLFPRHKEV